MSNEKRFERFTYLTVVDQTRSASELQLVGPPSKPFGNLAWQGPKPPEIDPVTGEVKYFGRREESNKARELRLKQGPLRHQPDDDVKAEVVFIVHEVLPSTVALQVTIAPENVPATVDRNLIGNGYVVQLVLPAQSLKAIAPEMLQKVFGVNELGAQTCIREITAIPSIIKRTHKYNEKEDLFYILELPIDNSLDQMKSTNLLTAVDHIWKHEPSRRDIEALQAMARCKKPFVLDLWIQMDNRETLPSAVNSVIERFQVDLRGNCYQAVHQKNLSPTANQVFINSGSLKPIENRPPMECFPSNSYHNALEMCTRLAVGLIEVKEHREAQVLGVNARGAVIRILEITGAGDLSYYGILKLITACDDEEKKSPMRLEQGDRLKINFRTKVTQIVTKDDWQFTVMKPFSWMVQGEVIGHLVRPRVPVAPDATDVEKKNNARPLISMKLPVQPGHVHSLEEARQAVEDATPLKCSIVYSTSTKSETRLIQGVDILLNCSRPVNTPGRKNDDNPFRTFSQSVEDWQQVLLMKDPQITKHRDLLPQNISKNYMRAKFQDEDHLKVLNHIYSSPVTKNGKSFCMIGGIAGAGKSSFMARLVISKQLGEPDTRIGLIATGNQPCDVLLKKVQEEYDIAKKDPKHAQLLERHLAIRVYHDKSETTYMFSTIDKKRLANFTALYEELEADRDAKDAAELAAEDGEFETFVPGCIEEDGLFDDGGETYTLKSPKQKKKGLTKGQKNAAKLAAAREAFARDDIQRDYTKDDISKAIVLDDVAYKGEGNKLTCYGNPLEGGVIDLNSKQIPAEHLAATVSVAMANQLNRQLAPTDSGVRDARYVEYKLSLGANALAYIEDHKAEYAALLNNFETYENQGTSMNKDARKDLNEGIKKLIADMKKIAKTIAITANSLGLETNRTDLGNLDLLIIDEIGTMSKAEFALIVGTIDIDDIIGIGDEHQLSPSVEMITPRGCTPELGQSIMQYFLLNH
jgi:hypothetical protein